MKTLSKIKDSQTDESSTQLRRIYPESFIENEEDKTIINILLPGYEKNQVKVDVQGRNLTVFSDDLASVDGESYLVRQFGIGEFKKSFRLSDQIDVNAIEAELQNGVLKITLLKKEELRITKSIEII